MMTIELVGLPGNTWGCLSAPLLMERLIEQRGKCRDVKRKMVEYKMSCVVNESF